MNQVQTGKASVEATKKLKRELDKTITEYKKELEQEDPNEMPGGFKRLRDLTRSAELGEVRRATGCDTLSTGGIK